MISIKAAMCQIFTLDGDRRGNFVRIENAIREAKDAGADIACFPETAIFGWVNPDAHKRACPIPGEDSDRLCKLAKDCNLYLCIGLAEKQGGNLYDSALLIDNKGNILLKHRKINLLAELMSPPYTPGDSIDAVETKFGKIGLLICADTHDSKILKRMAVLKPDL
ncbi:MAG TPA: carbon-nitrogen hydrolase family protein, partial [Sedimentisphaerales bacterium]|nr:carbon-nitrogen hydrolase family protein [Sedimentisphaerales bacterium]